MTNNIDKILSIVAVLLLIISIGYFYVTTSPSEEVDTILNATRDYTRGDIKRYITAESLYEMINDNDSSNDPYILSIRSTDHYALGHIPGAVNIDPRWDVFTEENLKELPKDKQIVVYCYTGHTAAQTTALLNVMGYDALCLKWGICSWVNESSVTLDKYYDQETNAHDYPTVTEESPGTVATINLFSHQSIQYRFFPTASACGGDTAPPPKKTDTSETSNDDTVILRDTSYIALSKSPVIKASDLYDTLNDADSSNDPFILSVRNAEHYAVGHISGAVNIGLNDLFTDEGLTQLPKDKDKQIVVVCYTGHTASQATALLNLNGYNATALMWGMCSWTTDSNVTVDKCFNKSTACKGYSFAAGIWDEDVQETIYDSLNPLKTVAITADSLHENLWDEDLSNDPFILSIRAASAYESGHIPGAENYGGITGLFTKENLAKLPYDKQIVVVCYTGHTASQTTALLNALGFNATALKWGMVGWCANTTIAPKGFERTEPNYPICTGTEPGTIDEAEEAAI